MNFPRVLVAIAFTSFGLFGPSRTLWANEPEKPREAKAITLTTLAVAQADARTARSPGPSQCRTEDVIYGHRDGMALTMDVFTPKGPKNGAGVIICVSAGYKSGRELLGLLHPNFTTPFLDRGYVVFAVMHSSQPKSTVPDIVEDVHRAVRFIKSNARQYGIEPSRLGITGGSAGGHLSLMMGCAGTAGDSNAKDPVDRASSKVAAVACFFPPTDFLALDQGDFKEFSAAFDFREMDSASGKLLPVSPAKRQQIGREISPLTHAGKDSSPTFIIHGDNDKTVPISQSEALVAKLKDCGVECHLVAKKGKGHLWFGIEKDVPSFADWFDRYLLGKK